MPYVNVDIDTDEFDDDDLIEILTARGYEIKKVPKAKPSDGSVSFPGVQDAAWRFSRGEYAEGLLILARENPELKILADVAMKWGTAQ